MATAGNAIFARTALSAATPTLIKANGAGVGGYAVFNDTGADLFVMAGTSQTVSASNFTWKVPSGQHLQEPAGNVLFIGPLYAYSVAGGNVNVTFFYP